MPTYSVQQLHELSQSTLVAAPEFKWSDWASAFRSRRRSSVASRPIVEPPRQKTVEFDEEELENDPDKAMAAFFLRQNQGPAPKETKEQPAEAPTPVAPAADSAIEEEEDGWTSVVKPRKRGMSRGWR